jgi:signal transduction histidine kinase
MPLSPGVPIGSDGEGIFESIPLHGSHDRVIGSLNVLTRLSDPLSRNQSRALRLAASQIQALVACKQQGVERRASSRGLTASSFVPGLVHELRNFIFGISASLDAFKASASSKRDPSIYAEHICKGLNRLNAFVEELRLFGDPKGSAKEEYRIETLLREVIEHHRLRSARGRVDIQLRIEEPLPPIFADRESLALAFIQLIDLAIEQESGGQVVLRVESRPVDESEMICGSLESATLNLGGLDPTRLFEPFYYRASGLGRLALPNARRIMEYHGGSLTAAALPEGGTRIRFMLPSISQHPRPSVDPS